MSFVDRILTIIITATLTSAVWIVAGGSLIKLAEDQSGEDSIRPAEAAPSPTPTSNPEANEPDTGGSSTATISQAPAQTLDKPADTAVSGGAEGTLIVPVLNVRRSDLTDTFAEAEPGQAGALHEALDIMAPVGTTVVAAAPGTIEKLFFSEAGGNTIYVRSGDRQTIHYYAHLDEYAEGLKEGQRVRRGQRLGAVGSTGNATADAPHLHFAILRTTSDAEWWEPATAVNPYPLLTSR